MCLRWQPDTSGSLDIEQHTRDQVAHKLQVLALQAYLGELPDCQQVGQQVVRQAEVPVQRRRRPPQAGGGLLLALPLPQRLRSRRRPRRPCRLLLLTPPRPLVSPPLVCCLQSDHQTAGKCVWCIVPDGAQHDLLTLKASPWHWNTAAPHQAPPALQIERAGECRRRRHWRHQSEPSTSESAGSHPDARSLRRQLNTFMAGSISCVEHAQTAPAPGAYALQHCLCCRDALSAASESGRALQTHFHQLSRDLMLELLVHLTNPPPLETHNQRNIGLSRCYVTRNVISLALATVLVGPICVGSGFARCPSRTPVSAKRCTHRNVKPLRSVQHAIPGLPARSAVHAPAVPCLAA
jgi:hypothetical protein